MTGGPDFPGVAVRPASIQSPRDLEMTMASRAKPETEQAAVSVPEPAPVRKAVKPSKDERVTTIAPDGREFVTTRREATRLNRTRGYKIK